MRYQCNNFPAYLSDVTDEVTLVHRNVAKNMEREWRAGIFLDKRDGSPVLVTAWGRIGTKLQHKVGDKHTFFPNQVANYGSVCREANNAIAGKSQKGYRAVSDLTSFDQQEISLAFKAKALVLQQPRQVPADSLQRVTF
jgi:predicted DNA-binding WGR domain protein